MQGLVLLNINRTGHLSQKHMHHCGTIQQQDTIKLFYHSWTFTEIIEHDRHSITTRKRYAMVLTDECLILQQSSLANPLLVQLNAKTYIADYEAGCHMPLVLPNQDQKYVKCSHEFSSLCETKDTFHKQSMN